MSAAAENEQPGSAAQPVNASEPLSALASGQRGKVVTVEITGAMRGRVMEMGFTVGTVVEVVRLAPLGDPMEFKVRGAHISLRKAEAACIRVQRA